MATMASRERILAAVRREDVDYVPCSIYFNGNLKVPGYDLGDWRERARLQLDLGGDPVVWIGIPNAPSPEVRAEVWSENVPGEPAPILFKRYDTPAGSLRLGVRTGGGWTATGDIPWGDHSASNLYEPLIKTPDDVDAFAYVWMPPEPSSLGPEAKARNDSLEFARRHGLVVGGLGGQGLATLLFVMGAENMVFFAMDHPDAFRRLAEIDSRTNVARIRLCAGAGADIVKRFGGYEQTNFFSPDIFRQVVLPLLKAEVAAAHEVGALIYYRVVTGMEPLLDDIATVGFDCIEGGEPCLSRCTLERWRDALVGRASSWTGVSTPVLLGGKAPDAVRAEVRHCIDVFGKRGFILGVSNSIRNHFPWEHTLAMIDEWKKRR